MRINLNPKNKRTKQTNPKSNKKSIGMKMQYEAWLASLAGEERKKKALRGWLLPEPGY